MLQVKLHYRGRVSSPEEDSLRILAILGLLVLAIPLSSGSLAPSVGDLERQGTAASGSLGPTLEVKFPQEGSRLELYTDRLVVLHQGKIVEYRADRTLLVRVAATNATNFTRDDHLHFGMDLEGDFTASTYGGSASLCYATECPIGVDKLTDGAHVLELRVHRKNHSAYPDPEAGKEVHLTLVKFDRAFAPAPSNDFPFLWVGTGLVGSIVAVVAVMILMRRARRASCIVEDVFLIYQDGRLIEEAHRAGPGSRVDTSLLASMLTAVLEFIKDSMKTQEGVRGFDYGTRRIMIAVRGRLILAVAVYGQETPAFRDRVDRTLKQIEAEWPGPTAAWDGSTLAFSGVQTHLSALLGTQRPGR